MAQTGGNTFAASIPTLPYQTFVEYRVIAYDNAGNSAVNDNQGFFYSYTVIPEFSPLILSALLFGAGLLVAVIIKKAKNQPFHFGCR
jgi:hypothetical protein